MWELPAAAAGTCKVIVAAGQTRPTDAASCTTQMLPEAAVGCLGGGGVGFAAARFSVRVAVSGPPLRRRNQGFAACVVVQKRCGFY